MRNTLITNAKVVTPLGSEAAKGFAMRRLDVRENAFIACVDGRIARIGTMAELKSYQMLSPVAFEHFDAQGCVVLPGFVDSHTHLIFGGYRADEFRWRLEGQTYMEIMRKGGGIQSTVDATRACTAEELADRARWMLDEMRRMGVTTVEAKSGYGLDRQTELKQLAVLRRLGRTQPVELAATYLGAHAVPEEYKACRDEYIRLMTEEMIPLVAREGLAEFCDVFCETGVFTASESEQILRAALAHGLKVKIHTDEIDAIGGTELAGALSAVSAEHLIAATDRGIAALAKGGTVAVLLPATSFYLGKPYARARDMIAAGVPVAVASDFNPGSCPSLNLQLVMNLACWNYRLTPEEVLTAATLNAAAAICRADRLGSLEVGKQADLVIWDAPNLDYIFYRFGQNLAKTVIKRGVVATTRP